MVQLPYGAKLLAGKSGPDEGLWMPLPVEYKHGRTKESDADRLQLCAQAMALEEMLVCEIPAGALFYEETRRREPVPFTPELRRAAQDMADEMHRPMMLLVRAKKP